MLLLSRFKISGHSMEPKIRNGSTVLITNFLYKFQKPQINDVVVFEINKKVFVKRVKKIKKEKYFVLGDNKRDSLDSRKFGPVLKNQILGKVIYNF